MLSKVDKWCLGHSTVLKRVGMVCVMLCLGVVVVFAQGDSGAGITAFESVNEGLKRYIEPVQTMIYIICAVTLVVGSGVCAMKMQNGEQDVKKTMMLLVGSCIFLVAAVTFLPKFFITD